MAQAEKVRPIVAAIDDLQRKQVRLKRAAKHSSRRSAGIIH
jgi:hypothetical protein